MAEDLLVCTGCEATFDLAEPRQRCEGCGEPLEVYLGDAPREIRGDAAGLERYLSFLPFSALDPPSAEPGPLRAGPGGARRGGLSPSKGRLYLGEGATPLLRAANLGGDLGLPNLFLKVEGQNPTGSFKDRGSRLGIQRALACGFRRAGTVSTGNMAASVAAYAARAGLPCIVLVAADIPPAKLGPIASYRPLLVAVRGDYGRLYLESLRIGRDLGIYFVNSDDPFRIEGQKLVAYEICEELAFAPPDHILLPVSSGGNLAAVLKGLGEMVRFGLLPRAPHVVGIQAAGCAPIAEAFAAGRQEIVPISQPHTVAKAISNPSPPSGNRVLRRLRGGGAGSMLAVSDEEILAAQRLLAAREGIFGQPDAAVPLAGVMKLLHQGAFRGDERIVCIITGHGLKDTTIFERCPPSVLETELPHLAEVLKSHAA